MDERAFRSARRYVWGVLSIERRALGVKWNPQKGKDKVSSLALASFRNWLRLQSVKKEKGISETCEGGGGTLFIPVSLPYCRPLRVVL